MQLQTIQENLMSLREIGLAMLQNPTELDLIQYANLVEDRCTDIEMELYVQPEITLAQLEEILKNR